MSDKEFEAQNAEVFGVVKSGQRLPSIACHLVTEKQYQHYQELEASAAAAAQTAQADKQNRVADVAIRVGMGCLFLGAIPRDWCDPWFGLIVAGICFFGAWARWMRYRHG